MIKKVVGMPTLSRIKTIVKKINFVFIVLSIAEFKKNKLKDHIKSKKSVTFMSHCDRYFTIAVIHKMILKR
jgi:hypothetical protein